MQPPVRYLEELTTVEEFTADDSEMKVILFGNDKSSAYTEVADYLREFGKFGRTTAEAAANQYDVEMPQILMWRTFGENPITFTGNMSNPQEIHQWTMNNYLPLFGEFSPTLYRRLCHYFCFVCVCVIVSQLESITWFCLCFFLVGA